MKLPQYIEFKSFDEYGNGTAYLLSHSPPFLIGKIVKFSSEDELTDWVARKKADTGRCIAGKVKDYSILVVYSGRLDGGVLLPESAIEFKKMAEWYYQEKVLPNERRYKKYLQEPV